MPQINGISSMSIKVSDKIPLRKFDQFHDILKSCGGRYINNPFIINKFVFVYYEYQDVHNINKHNTYWCRVTEDVSEIRKDQWWRKLVRRFFKYQKG